MAGSGSTVWGGNANVSDWKKGAKWEHVAEDNKTIRVVGKVEECTPHSRIVLSWAEPATPEDVSRVTFDLEELDDTVQLTVTHGNFADGSVTASKVQWGWPRVLANMKTFLETGTTMKGVLMKGGCGSDAACGCEAA